MNRKHHVWMVQLQRSDGQIVEREFRCYWDPAREDAAEQVADACAAQTTVFEGGNIDPQTGQRQIQYAGLTAILQDDPAKEPVAA